MNLETHKIGRFDIRGEWTPELLPPLYELLEHYESYLPGWCQIVYVRFVREMEEGTAEIQLKYEYRSGVLGVGQMFFDRKIKERAELLVHEIIHANQGAFFDIAIDLLTESIGSNELAMNFAEKQLRESLEGATCDLTALIMRIETDKEKQHETKKRNNCWRMKNEDWLSSDTAHQCQK